jgi:TPP-dependent 2-oxoacid decarboxylase
MTVASYLKTRLEGLGLSKLFGVPSHYTAPLLNTILEDNESKIKLVSMTDELMSGYAADGYTRV